MSSEAIRITLKNYRCFSDESPVSIELRRGEAIALIGINNSGKTSLLRSIYELRNLWGILKYGSGNFYHLMNGFPHSWVNFYGVQDQEEIFYNENEREFSVEIDLPEAEKTIDGHENITRCVFMIDRFTHLNACQFYSGRNPIKNGSGQISMSTEGTESKLRKGDGTPIYFSDWTRAMSLLEKSLYIGAFRNAIGSSSGRYHDLAIGSDFIKNWDNWKTGGVKKNQQIAMNVTKEIENIFSFDKLEINAGTEPDIFSLAVNQRPYRLDELGSGLAQFIITVGNAAMNSPSIILIDEPESNLHPALQRKFVNHLAGYADYCTVFSTHSIGLAKSVADHIMVIQKIDGVVKVRPFESSHNYIELLGELSFSAAREVGVENLLIVEGVNDIKVIQQFLQKLGSRENVVILPLGGSQFISDGREQELSEIQKICPKVFVLIDSERQSKEARLDKKREKFVESCNKLGFTTCVTERRAIENYLSERAIKKIISEKGRALGLYEKLSSQEHGWNKSQNWQIAREMRRSEFEDTDLGRFLNKI